MSEDVSPVEPANAEQPTALGVGETLHNLFAKLAEFRLATTLLFVALLIDVAYETILPLSVLVAGYLASISFSMSAAP